MSLGIHRLRWLTFRCRRNHTSHDISKTDLTDDTSAHEVDISAFVPATCTAVSLFIQGKDGASGSYCRVTDIYDTGNYNMIECNTKVANLNEPVQGIVAVIDQKIKVMANPKPTDWTWIYINITSWWQSTK